MLLLFLLLCAWICTALNFPVMSQSMTHAGKFCILFYCLLNFVKINFYKKLILKYHQSVKQGAQWLSGRVLDLRPRGRGFEPH